MKKEDVQEYLDCNGFEALTHVDGNKYYDEKTVISIALEVVKNCSIPIVSQQRELLNTFITEYNKGATDSDEIIKSISDDIIESIL